jgi:hypothetical protein
MASTIHPIAHQFGQGPFTVGLAARLAGRAFDKPAGGDNVHLGDRYTGVHSGLYHRFLQPFGLGGIVFLGLQKYGDFLGPEARVVHPERHHAARDGSRKLAHCCLDVLRVNVPAGNNDDILLTANDIVLGLVPEAIIPAEIPTISERCRGIHRVISVAFE